MFTYNIEFDEVVAQWGFVIIVPWLLSNYTEALLEIGSLYGHYVREEGDENYINSFKIFTKQSLRDLTFICFLVIPCQARINVLSFIPFFLNLSKKMSRSRKAFETYPAYLHAEAIKLITYCAQRQLCQFVNRIGCPSKSCHFKLSFSGESLSLKIFIMLMRLPCGIITRKSNWIVLPRTKRLTSRKVQAATRR